MTPIPLTNADPTSPIPIMHSPAPNLGYEAHLPPIMVLARHPHIPARGRASDIRFILAGRWN